MRILFVAHRYDYGRPERGYSFEHYNFHESLVGMGHEVVYFDFHAIAAQRGKDEMNRRLLEVVRVQQPDLMFTVVWQDLLDPRVVRQISEETDTVTLNWYCDDHWQFESLSRRWTPCFNWVVTTAQGTLPRYEELGYRNVVKSQWGCNHGLYRKLNLPLKYDVTFVGLPHGVRRSAVQALIDEGIDVQVWGTGWGHGRLSQQRMIEVFNQSRINLNFSEASSDGSPKGPWEQLTHHYVSRHLYKLPGGWRLVGLGKSLVSRMTSSGDRPAAAAPRQIKGRNFEVPGCGGFLLTGQAENLEQYYRVGQEVAVYDGVTDLIDKIRYYLAHEDQRRAIAEAGYQRTLQEHTYERRFNEIFKAIGVADRRADGGRQVAA